MVLASLCEGLSIAALLPLLGVVLGDGQAASGGLAEKVDAVLEYLRVEPTVGGCLGVIAVAMFLKAGLLLLAMTQVGYTAAHVATELRLSFINSLMKARWHHFVTLPSGALANALTTEATRARNAYLSFCRIMSEVVQIGVYSYLSLMISWKVTVAAAACGGLTIILLSGLVGAAGRAGLRLTESMNFLSSGLVDGIQGIKTLKAMACEDLFEPFLKGEIQSLKLSERKIVITTQALGALQEPIMVLALVMGIYLAVTFWNMQFDNLVVLGVLFWRTFLRFAEAQRHYQNVESQQSAFWSMQSAIQRFQEAREASGGHRAPSLRDGITLQNVGFSYGDKVVLRNVSLTVPVGGFTAVVGPSGAGKTTIADLVIGLFTPQSGEVFVDGVSMAELDMRAWRHMIGYVPQEVILFHESVYTNVTLGETSLTRFDAEAALKTAGAWDFVSELDQGMDSVVGERGAKLSGGQRQRIAIARALVRKPELLILDEVTTALDPSTEAAICSTLKQLSGGVTVLAISHQPALVEAANLVYRLEAGTVIRETKPGPASSGAAIG